MFSPDVPKIEPVAIETHPIVETFSHIDEAEAFLGAQRQIIPQERINQIVAEREKKIPGLLKKVEEGSNPTYRIRRAEDGTFLAGDKPVTAGRIVASRHLRMQLTLPPELDETAEGLELRTQYLHRTMEDGIAASLNRELAKRLADNPPQGNVEKGELYQEIYEYEKAVASGEQKEYFGFYAEKMMRGVAEMISIDYPDFGMQIYQSNAHQDVEDKIDFIIMVENDENRGVGIKEKNPIPEVDPETGMVTYGVQFSVDAGKKGEKDDQLTKARKRSRLADILAVYLDGNKIQEAKKRWEFHGKQVGGPWDYLPIDTRKRTLEALFKGILSKDQLERIQNDLV